MRKSLGLLFALMFSVVVFSADSLAASNVILSLSTNTLTLSAGSSDYMLLTVTNNEAVSDVFSISMFPSAWGSINIVPPQPSLLLIAPNSSVTSRIHFTAPNCTASSLIGFAVSATSVNDKSVSSSQNFNLMVKGSTTCITSFGADNYILAPGDTVTMTSDVQNVLSVPVSNYLLDTVISKDGKAVKSFETNVFVPAQNSGTYDVKYTFDKYAEPGVYDVSVVLKGGNGDTIDSESTVLKVLTYAPAPLAVNSTEDYLLIKRTTTTISNYGNVKSGSYSYQLTLPGYVSLFFNPFTMIDSTSPSGGGTIYSWQVPSLAPGESFTIKYEISVINVWTIGIVLAVILYAIYLNFYSVSVVKGYYLKGALDKGKEVSVSLEVKNNGYREVNDLVVRDKVPSVAKLEEKFETLKPITRKLMDGMELTWRIDSVKPHETRVLTYRIRPVMEIIGTLNLPEAKAVFEGAGGRKTTKLSNIVAIR